MAKGNGIKITKAELERTYHQNLLLVTGKPVTREGALDELINRAIGIREAKKIKLHDNPVVKYKMEDVLFHAKVSKDLENKLSKIKVSEKDVKAYYRNHPEYKTSHILFRTKVVPSPGEEAGAAQVAQEVYQTLLKQPKKFAKLAEKYSQSSTGVKGGEMGFQPAARMAPEYFEAIKGKKKGYISPPVKSQFGFHIIKVLDSPKSYKKIELPLYKKIVYDRKRDKIIENYFSSLRKKEKIAINQQLLSAPRRSTASP